MTASAENNQTSFYELTTFLSKVPAVEVISHDYYESKNWWIKFSIDITHTLAWNVVQEVGHVANYISINERLPTVFYPVSPPPYMNGGPAQFLSWIIESTDTEFTPAQMAEWLEGRLPNPVEDKTLWAVDQE